MCRRRSLRASKIGAKTTLFSVSSTSRERRSCSARQRCWHGSLLRACESARALRPRLPSAATSMLPSVLPRTCRSNRRHSLIAPGEEAQHLASLPLTVLDLTEEQAETFSLWGIHTLGMLAALPEKELIARMGQEGKRLRQLARGRAAPSLSAGRSRLSRSKSAWNSIRQSSCWIPCSSSLASCWTS